MAHFAHVKNNIVDAVIVIGEEVISNAGGWTCPKCNSFVALDEWVQTSYNTRGGEHILGGEPLRKNFAGIGYAYDAVRDAFIPPQPYSSWTLNENTCLWESPIPMSEKDTPQRWNEDLQAWEDVILNS